LRCEEGKRGVCWWDEGKVLIVSTEPGVNHFRISAGRKKGEGKGGGKPATDGWRKKDVAEVRL